MRVLVTGPHPLWPCDSGPSVRTLGIARALAGLGHAPSVLACGASPPPEAAPELAWRPYAARGRLGHFLNRDFRRAYREALAERPALVVASYPYQAFMLVGPAARAGVPLVYDAQNAEAVRFRRLGRPLLAAVVRAAEAHLCARARAVLAVTPEEQRLLERAYGCRAWLLPNGVDLARFHPGPPDEALSARYGLAGRPVALYFGFLAYGPNREALRFLVEEAWPEVRRRVPEAALLVVGRDPPDWLRGRPGLVVAGPVEDIAAHVRLANVVAAPLRSGGGMSLKILEALACGQTVLSTPFGARGLPEGAAGDGLLLAELPGFGARLAELLARPPAPGSSAAARRLAEPFDWGRLVAGVDWPALASAILPRP